MKPHRQIFMAKVFSAILAGVMPSCAGPQQNQGTTQTSEETEPLRNRAIQRVETVGDVLIVHVQWGRAEELAETLRPLLVQKYGPNILVEPRPKSNLILIRILPEGPARAAPGTAPR